MFHLLKMQDLLYMYHMMVAFVFDEIWIWGDVFILTLIVWLVAWYDQRDHAGGNEKIKQLVPDIKVYGGSLDKVKGCTDAVDNGDKLTLGQDINILALHTPWFVFFFFFFSNEFRCI